MPEDVLPEWQDIIFLPIFRLLECLCSKAAGYKSLSLISQTSLKADLNIFHHSCLCYHKKEYNMTYQRNMKKPTWLKYQRKRWMKIHNAETIIVQKNS